MTSRQRVRRQQQQELNVIFRLHQDGIHSFERHEYESAKDAFNSAFSSITRLLRETRNRDSFFFRGSPLVRESGFSPPYCCTCTSSGDDSDQAISPNKREKTSCSLAITSARSAMPSSILSSCGGGDDFPLFYQPLQLPKSVTVNQFVFVTLYNSALATHLVAMGEATPHPKQDALMKRAARQWGLVYALQWREGLNLKPTHGLAILLNLGHAKSMTGNKSGSTRCYQNILSAIHILESRKHNIPNKDFFVYNAFRMLGGHTRVITASAA